MERHNALLFDNCIFQRCNLMCKYCRSADDIISTQSLKNVMNSIEIVKKHVDVPILKLSGYGEITLQTNYLDIIENQSKDFEKIQVITNGILLNTKDIEKISEIRNLSICISLDGHIQNLNKARDVNHKQMKHVLQNIKKISDLGIPLEINCVISRFNTKGLRHFLDFLKSFNINCNIFMFPVRENYLYAKNYETIKPSKKDSVEAIADIIKDYEEWKEVLPPLEYLHRLKEFYKTGRRNWNCYIPAVNLGIDPKGDIVKCACGLGASFGNIFTNPENAFTNRFSDPDIIETRNTRGNCSDCFTHYEILNLYFDKEIELKHLKSLVFSGERTRRRLLFLKKRMTKA